MERERSIFSEDTELNAKSRRNLCILEVLRRRGPLSRTEISRASGINPVTVSHYIDKLIVQDLVYEKEFDVSTGGRRPLLLDINPRAAYSIGIGINLFSSTGVIVDLDGNILFSCRRDNRINTPGDLIEAVAAIGDELMQKTEKVRSKIRGIGIGLGGIIDEKNQIIRWPGCPGKEGAYAYVSMPLRQYMMDRYGVPVSVGNDANLACFAESWLSLDPGVKNVVYMFSGVGCGIMLNGELYAGSQGCAGEFFLNGTLDDLRTEMGDASFLRQWPQDLGVIARANRLLREQYHTRKEVKNIAEVFSLSLDGVGDIIEDAARALGMKIAMIVNLLNPDVIIIGGGFECGGYTFAEKVYGYVKRYAFDEMTKSLKVIASGLGEHAVALGAANLVVRSVFSDV
jgi:predicted NBD/HSP70 family sugar kinase